MLLGEFGEAEISYSGKVSGGEAGFSHRQPRSIEHRNSLAFSRKEIRGGDSRDSTADHHDVHFEITFESPKLRQLGGIDPIRRSLHIKTFALR